MEFSQELIDYFSSLDLMGIKLTEGQKKWYAKKRELLNEDISREFPSFPEEAFQSSQIGAWYAQQMKEVYDQERVLNISYDRALPVHTAWDLGQADFMAIWFFQLNRVGEIMLIDYFQKSNCPLDQIVNILNSKNYTYGKHIWPHDAKARDRAGITFEKQAMHFNLKGIVLEQGAILDGINLVRSTLSRCWFDQNKCKEGLLCLEHYSKKWNNTLGGYSSEPLHNLYSHGADGFRYLCMGLNKVSNNSDVADEMKALRIYWGG